MEKKTEKQEKQQMNSEKHENGKGKEREKNIRNRQTHKRMGRCTKKKK
jgi:hypothetical protein